MAYRIAIDAPTHAFALQAVNNGNPDGLRFLRAEVCPAYLENFHDARLNTHLTTTNPDEATGFTIFEQRFAELTAHRMRKAGHRAMVVYQQPALIRPIMRKLGLIPT